MEKVAIVGGLRTAFVRAGGAFSDLSTVELLASVLKACYQKYNLAQVGLDEFVAGSVLHDPNTPNVARESIIHAGLPLSLSANAVSNNCITGLVAVNYAAESIRCGRVSSVLAGGAEAMSKPTLTFSKAARDWFLALNKAKNVSDRIRILSQFRLKYFSPKIPGPREPSTGLTMGEHCELMVKEFAISREAQDNWAYASHQKSSQAQNDGKFKTQIVDLNNVSQDNIIRANTTKDKLASLPPVFDRSSAGSLTAGNSSSLTDGASLIWLTSETKAKNLGLEILGYVEACEFAAIKPNDGLLMAPTLALPRLMKRLNLTLDDIDLFEIHEAFAGQVLCSLKAWESGWDKYPEVASVGKITEDKINLWGGSLAMGHPFAATGGRLILSAVDQLKQYNKNRAVLSVCAAGAMGAVMSITKA